MDSNELIEFLKRKGIKENNKYLADISGLKLEDIYYSEMYKSEEDNDYSKLEGAKKKLGVYIFYTEKDNKLNFIYVGECHTLSSKRDLKIRITQHFTASNTGGMPYNVGGKDENKAQELINKFIEDKVKITYIILEKTPREIILMESFLISALEPTYNFFKIGEKVEEEDR